MRDRSRSRDRKPAIAARTALALGALALLGACGDSLDSRNEAAGLDPRASGGEMTLSSQNNTSARSSRAAARSPDAQPTSQGFSEDGEDGDVLEVDAGAETFIDSASGFDPSPMDDTMGFDPNPADIQAPPED